jgi:hypothetical protein
MHIFIACPVQVTITVHDMAVSNSNVIAHPNSIIAHPNRVKESTNFPSLLAVDSHSCSAVEPTDALDFSDVEKQEDGRVGHAPAVANDDIPTSGLLRELTDRLTYGLAPDEEAAPVSKLASVPSTSKDTFSILSETTFFFLFAMLMLSQPGAVSVLSASPLVQNQEEPCM